MLLIICGKQQNHHKKLGKELFEKREATHVCNIILHYMTLNIQLCIFLVEDFHHYPAH